MTERRILVVDDDPDLLETLRILLEHGGELSVTTAETARDALRLLESPEPFHLVISDLRLGEDNGTELLRESRRLRPQIPRVLLTGFGDEGIARAGIEPDDAEQVFQKDRLITSRRDFLDAIRRLTEAPGGEAPPTPDSEPDLVMVPVDWWGLVPDPFAP